MIRASTKPVLSSARLNAATLRPALIVVCAAWITSAVSLFVLVLCSLHVEALVELPFVALATGFCLYQTVHATQRYRRGLPLHEPSPNA